MSTPLSLDEAVALTRTGDLWLFRGRSTADRAIQAVTNAPVNHVGMAVVLEDLPPLMWHAELGRSLTDVWTGTRHRGVQLHDLRDAVMVWSNKYGQRAWLRQLDATITEPMEAAVLETIARLDGTPFPSTARLAGKWLKGRLPRRPTSWQAVKEFPGVVRELLPPLPRVPRPGLPGRRRQGGVDGADGGAGGFGDGGVGDGAAPSLSRRDEGAGAGRGSGTGGEEVDLTAAMEAVYCAEVVAATYQAMGLLDGRHDPDWYDPGKFWSGDDLHLIDGASLGPEIRVVVPSPPDGHPSPTV